jgi:hypothetical protein
MKTLIAVRSHILAYTGSKGFPLPFHWYADHGPEYIAQGRQDGLIYIGGFSTREKAEEWAIKQGIMPEPSAPDPQGCL